jgi:hypothetical protein
MNSDNPGQTHYYGDGCDPPHVPQDDKPMTDEEWEPFAAATGIEPLNDPEVTPGELCRATMYDDPAAVADAMRTWFGADDDRRRAAVIWLWRVGEALGDGNAE